MVKLSLFVGGTLFFCVNIRQANKIIIDGDGKPNDETRKAYMGISSLDFFILNGRIWREGEGQSHALLINNRRGQLD